MPESILNQSIRDMFKYTNMTVSLNSMEDTQIDVVSLDVTVFLLWL